jgi:general secretion pathway protein A
VLSGQPSLTSLLRRRELRSLDRRIKTRCVLTPLLADEAAGYVMHRLSVAGSSVRVEFDDSAIARIHAISRGVPRLVNLLCDHALTRGRQASASVIDADLIEDAAGDLDLAAPRSVAAQLARTAAVITVLFALMLVGAGGAAWVFRDRVQQAIAVWRTPAR